MPADYPVWIHGVTPCTDPNAKPSRWRLVENVVAIRVKGATYRNCQPIDGVFERVDRPTRRAYRELRCEVYCA